jgi:4'-phosphopantetheinyl transferase
MSASVHWRDDLNHAWDQEGAIVFTVALNDAASALAPNERDLSEAPDREPLRSHFLARRALARRALASRLGVAEADVTIGHAETGAPFIVAPESRLHISFAGRGNFCAIGVATSAIGVDIEPIGAPAEPAWNILHENERRDLAALQDIARHEQFLCIWTAKEAYLKALGLGLMREPSVIEIMATSGESFVVRDGSQTASLAAAQWRRITLCGQKFVAACVVVGSEPGADELDDGALCLR